MPRLIDANALVKMLERHKKDCNPDHFNGHETFIEKIDAHDGYGEWQFANGFNLGVAASIVDTEHAPTIDAVEVVRCKDCKHSEHWYGDKCLCSLWSELGIDVFEDGYCSYGERREDETN